MSRDTQHAIKAVFCSIEKCNWMGLVRARNGAAEAK